MNAKKIVGLILMRPAFTQRNITSLLLVGVFIGAYVLMGGKITTELPRAPRGSGSGFGSVSTETGRLPESVTEKKTSKADVTVEPAAKTNPEELLGSKPTSERKSRQRAIMGYTDTSEEERESAEKETIDKEGLIKGSEFRNHRDEWRLKQSEKQPVDSLDAIEERLRINRANN